MDSRDCQIADNHGERWFVDRRTVPYATAMLKPIALALMLCASIACWSKVPSFRSAHVVVVDETTGEVLLEKDALTAAPIASLTKLMTAMVVLDAGQDLDETLRIDNVDRDTLRHSRGGLRVGAMVPRRALLELALLVSDNHAAAALARCYPGGPVAFADAMQRKIAALGLANTRLVEPTGLSPDNHASALDMVKLLQATKDYPLVAQITSQRTRAVVINGRQRPVHNTNALVGRPGWDILTSKTGYTTDAGRCLTMRMRVGDRTVSVVLIGALASSSRSLDAQRIRRWLDDEVAARAAALAGQRASASIQGSPAAAQARPALLRIGAGLRYLT
jgi:D-alanyl-D-alanine carboxypeptidase/D-alanyl-D-alanine endopeptidase (penicillin-binding protein 7)